ncbi:uncharacterized protein LOC142611990 [Castanea sativa]|uniref:uncharacterized protein LOC142611990 n=1 Tax=Castanea sativa TaxID=21020 RepID=UPI003F64AE9A
MLGISSEIIQHKLDVDPEKKLVQQRRRMFAPERNQATMDEVNKLLQAGFIREIYYPDWLANIVLVKKTNGKWRMCVDFTDLNKTCLKDSFPLPSIDQMMDSTTGHKLLTFMDAFSGSNLPKTISNVVKPQQVRFWGGVREVLGIHGVPEGNRGKPREGTSYIGDGITQDREGSPKAHRKDNSTQQGAEAKYLQIEKIAFALIVASRKLRPYFQVNPILVMTDQPIKKTMNKPEAAERMIQWAKELSQFDIEYHPRTTIKAQTLADFIAEFIVPDEEENTKQVERWTIQTEGSSVQKRGKVGVIIITAEGETLKYGIQLAFLATNNKAKYKGIKGEFEAKEERMQKYLKLTKLLAQEFDQVEFTQIPISQNMGANKLVKQSSLEAEPIDTELKIDVQKFPNIEEVPNFTI